MRLAFTGLSSCFEENATIVTRSPILAAVVSQEYSQSQLQYGRESWRRPAIFSIDVWLTSRWQEARYSDSSIPALLSTSQEHVLWQNTIEKENPGLFDVNATAALARRSANLTAEWNIPLEGEAWTENQDAQQFQVWYKLFRSKCREENWVARRGLWKLLPAWIAAGLCATGATVFAGFDQLSPGLKGIRDALRKSQVFGNNEDFAPPPVLLTSCTDFKAEVEHAARWARALFEEQPARSIAVFVPELASNRALIERTFHGVFYAGSALRFEAPSGDSAFHVSAAQPLADHPLIAGALLLLDLARARIGHANAAAILRSPFIAGAAQELSARSLADLNLRRRRELDVTLRDIEYASRGCPLLVPVWPAVRRVLRDRPQKAELAGWGEFIGDLLQAVGWPGDVELTSREQEAVEAWKNAVSALGALGMVSAPVSFEAALSHLRRILSGGGLERGDWFSPVQILDASEAAGLKVDCALLTGLSDETWPPAVRVSPLIPLSLQRANDLPGIGPERERLTRSLLAAAPVLAGSYSGRLSPFIQRMTRNSRKQLPIWKGKLPVQSFAPIALDEVGDNQAPPFDLEHEIRGGTSIIRAQSLCPFRAFAEVRLRAQTPEDACFGFDARDRGGFLHTALQYVWQNLKTQARLKLMPQADLQQIVREAVLRAVSERPDSAFYEQSTRVERERLEELILDWLTDVEKQRLQPFTVESVEDALEYNLAGLPLRLRIDRMDRLKNGQLVLIDYKSGAQTKGKLNCPRPPEPQLLVYAAAKGSEVDGILFGQLRPRELRLVGISREKHFKGTSIAVLNDKWDETTEASRVEVERLARNFLRGDALVDPIKGACEYCGIKPLCRVSEKTGEERDAD